MKRFVWTSLALTALVAALAGCSPGGQELARVGRSVITRDDFEAAARVNGRIYAQLGDSAKAVLLDDLVKRQLLVEAAKQTGLYRDSMFLDFTKNMRDQVLRSALTRDLVGDVKVSEGEARAFYERQGVEGHVRIVFVPTREMGEAAKRELDRGTDFGLVAARYNQSSQLPPGGDVGWVKGGALISALDEALVSGPVGKVTGPVEQRGLGWFLMKLEERRKVAGQQPYDAVREQIVGELTQRKRVGALQRRANWLLTANEVRVQPGAPQLLSGKLRAAGEQMQLDPMHNRPKIALTEPEQAFVLARWRGGTFTLAEAIAALDHGVDPPNAMMQPLVERWIEDQALQRVLVREAERRRLADDPDNARMLRERENQYLLEGYYTRQVADAVTVSEEELRALHHVQTMQGGSRLQSADLLVTMLQDSALALRVLDHGAHGGTLQQAVRMAGANSPVGPFTLSFPSSQPLWQQMEARIETMRPGEISGPFRTPMGYMIIQLLRSGYTTDRFEDLPMPMIEQLRNALLERKRELRFQAVTDSLRRAIPVTIHRDVLAKTPWPAMDIQNPGSFGG